MKIKVRDNSPFKSHAKMIKTFWGVRLKFEED